MGQAADGWIALATQMIQQYGQELPFYLIKSKDGEQEYSPDELSSPPSEDEDPNDVYEFYGAPLDFNLRDMDKVAVISGEKMLWVPGTTIAGEAIIPEVGDIVTFSQGAGKSYRVNEVTSYETESVNCAFLLKIGA